ncbi:MAG: FapA family protein [Ketobacteraceae bacterium]|nr:FapA family protein [Ketobacteraceae bacterium]
MELSVYYNEQDKTLYGEVTASESGGADPITPALIQQKTDSLGYKNLVLNPQAVNQLCASANREEPLSLPLKILIDGEVRVEVSPDRRQATLTLHKADGGKSVDQEMVKQAIQGAGICEELVNWAAVETALNRGQVSELVIAKAVAPENGRDATYVPLVSSEVDRVPVTDEKGVADMLSAHQFVMVNAGEPLMRREPATSGEPGRDVTGAPIAARPGTDPGFKPGLEGSELAADDPDLLIASIKGHPVLFPNGVAVDPVLHVDNVDLRTGNIHFDGSLEVKGDVTPGLEINVSGDVEVKGTVERARIKAGNQVIVHGGVFGQQEIDEDAGMSEEDSQAHFDIQAGGDVEAGFLNQVAIHSQGAIRVKQYAAHSFLKADGVITLGQGGGKGILFGGLIWAARGAVIAQAGNDSYVPTTIWVGERHKLEERKEQIRQQREARESEASQLSAIFEKIKRKHPSTLGKVSVDKARRIDNTIKSIRQTIAELDREAEQLEEAIQAQQDVCLTITRRLCPNTTVSIHGVVRHFSDEQKPDSWYQAGDVLIPARDMKEN